MRGHALSWWPQCQLSASWTTVRLEACISRSTISHARKTASAAVTKSNPAHGHLSVTLPPHPRQRAARAQPLGPRPTTTASPPPPGPERCPGNTPLARCASPPTHHGAQRRPRRAAGSGRRPRPRRDSEAAYFYRRPEKKARTRRDPANTGPKSRDNKPTGMKARGGRRREAGHRFDGREGRGYKVGGA